MTAQADSYTTRDSNLAQFLIYTGRRCRCHIADDNGAAFAFEDGQDLRAQVEAYLHGAAVPAIAYAEAGRITRSLILRARHSRGGSVRRTTDAEVGTATSQAPGFFARMLGGNATQPTQRGDESTR